MLSLSFRITLCLFPVPYCASLDHTLCSVTMAVMASFPSPSFFFFICGYVLCELYVFVSVIMCTCACLHVEMKGQHPVPVLSYFPLLFLRQNLLLWHSSVCLAVQWTVGICLFLTPTPVLGLQMPSFVCRFWRTALRASPLLGKLFTNWTIFPCPPFYFLRLGITMLLKLPSTFGRTWSSCPISPWLGLEASTTMLCTTMPLRSSFNVSFKR